MSAGTSTSARIKVSAKLISWADCIFVMEEKHRKILWDKFPDEVSDKKIVILDIEDAYPYMDKELIEMIQISVDPFL